MNACFWLSLLALLVTKAADVVSTWRHVGVQGESNPIVRPVFQRFGLAGGLMIVCTVYLVFALGQYAVVWWIGHPVLVWGNTLLGFLIAWAQWDVARFNTTRRHSALTRFVLRVYARWSREQAHWLSQIWGRRR
jgi:hypothetical protein